MDGNEPKRNADLIPDGIFDAAELKTMVAKAENGKFHTILELKKEVAKWKKKYSK